MPSPITHLVAAGATCYIYKKIAPKDQAPPFVHDAGLFVAAAAFSLAPDLDFIPGLLLHKVGSFHNCGFHSLCCLLPLAWVCAIVLRCFKPGPFQMRLLLITTWLSLHSMLDTLCLGRGVMLFWPLSTIRFQSPILFFLGVRWSSGLLAISHIYTVLNEVLFAVGLWFGILVCNHPRRPDLRRVEVKLMNWEEDGNGCNIKGRQDNDG